MRAIAVPVVALALAGCASVPNDATSLNGHSIDRKSDSAVIATMTSPVYEADKSRDEIIAEAESCANRHLSMRDVTTSGGSNPIIGPSERENIGGGSVVQQVSPDQGILVANGRTEYRHALLAHTAEATLVLEAKEGRYRITYQDPQAVQHSSGYAQQSGFSPVRQRMGTGWDASLSALQDMGGQVAECIDSDDSDDW